VLLYLQLRTLPVEHSGAKALVGAGFSAPYSRAMPRNIAPRVKAVQLVGDPDERRCAMLVHALVKPCAAWPQGTPLQVSWSALGADCLDP